MMNYKLLNVIFLFLVQLFFSQERIAKIQPVENDGFHQILISPEIRSASKNNLDFVRILDEKKNEVPYVILKKQKGIKVFRSFEILSKNTISNVSTSVIILNKEAKKLDELNLKIANTAVSKKYSISGSNDEKEWFGLVDDQIVNELSDPNSTFVIRSFKFPTNQYQYLKFTFVDKNSLPINVLEVGSENVFQNSSVLVELNSFTQKITQNKESKQTIIRIEFPEPQVIDALKFKISAPNFYLRNVGISRPKTSVYKKNSMTVKEEVTSFQLSSKSVNSFEIPTILSKVIFLTIDNLDNSALKIDKISFYQNPVSILADLKKQAQYSLIIDSTLSKPNYDLAEMNINNEENFPVAKIDNLEIQKQGEIQKVEKSFWQTSLFMWICILIAIVAIGYFAINMVKDMNREK